MVQLRTSRNLHSISAVPFHRHGEREHWRYACVAVLDESKTCGDAASITPGIVTARVPRRLQAIRCGFEVFFPSIILQSLQPPWRKTSKFRQKSLPSCR